MNINMNSAELCKWLRDNSSGVYRPSALAADRIESLEEALEYTMKQLSKGSLSVVSAYVEEITKS
tara:strand:+ start:1710 stop:1904 length:195 start_codon:yes stop_codon:yes gene_type:complete